jgi:pyrroline-5-carboxylate reductase
MKLGFIGCGNMASAIIGGIVKSGLYSGEDIIASDMQEDKLRETGKRLGINTTTDNKKSAEAKIVLLCVKPAYLYNVIDEIKNTVTDDTLVISIAAGQSSEKITNAFGRKIKLVRVMPNTPALVGEGMAALSPSEEVTESDIKNAKAIFESCGKAEIVSESLMDAVTAVSGSSPAYVFMFIEAMADAAVRAGMPRAQAYTFAAQAVKGSAEMVLETGMHPAVLKDQVCSPAGTTIESVAVLEERGFRSAVIEAMQACVDKSKSM